MKEYKYIDILEIRKHIATMKQDAIKNKGTWYAYQSRDVEQNQPQKPGTDAAGSKTNQTGVY